MKKTALSSFALAVALVLLATPAYAYLAYLGTIDATSSVSATNGTATTPFRNTRSNLLGGGSVAVQCDGAAWVSAVSTSATTVTKSGAGAGVKIDADMLYVVDMSAASNGWLAVIGDSSSVNCRVYSVISRTQGGTH